MPEPHEIRLDDNSRIRLCLTRAGALSVQLYRPGTNHEGHGLFLWGSAFVEGAELQALLDALSPLRTEANT